MLSGLGAERIEQRFVRCFDEPSRPLVDMQLAPPSEMTSPPNWWVHVSTLRLDSLSGNPVVEVRIQEPHPGARQFYERNPSFLDEPSDVPLGASQSVGRRADIQKWPINVFEI